MPLEVEATAQLAPCSECGEIHGEDALRCPATDVMLALEGRRLDGKFRFLSSLGAGGMASVYLAVNERVDREVAIKFLRPEVGRDPESVARFRSEAKAAGRIGNKHICEILDLGDSPIGPFIVMERLRGVDLAALIRRQVRLDPAYAVRVVRHALEGLAAAHAAGIVHRDLKPGNIFLHRTDGGETIVKLMDFGVSKFLDGTGEAQTASGILLGTPEYMAPEQLEGAHKIGPTADIWAMGAILYRAITGHQVFSGPSLAAVIKSMALDEVKPMAELVEGVPPELQAVIHRCLERSVPDRYQSCEELSEALAPFEDVQLEVIPIIEPGNSRSVQLSSVPVVDAGSVHEQTMEFEPDPEPSPPPDPGSLSVSISVSVGPPVAPAPTPVELAPEPPRRRGLRMVMLLLGTLLVAVGAVALWSRYVEPVEPWQQLLGMVGLEGSSGPEAEPDRAGGHEDGSESPPDLPDPGTSAGETGGSPVPERETGGVESGEGDTHETTAGATDSEGETGQETGGQEFGTERPAPAGTFRGGVYITPNEPGPTSDLAGAKQHCANLAQQRFAGEGGWSLANPAELAKFVGSRELKRGKYWTTALHAGKAAVYSMPGGKKSSEKADRKLARPLCVAKF
jgi:serine/threonine protein kinase